MILKKKIKYDDIIKLIVQLGYERYIALNNELSNIYSYNPQYFYIIFQIINLFIFQRLLKFQNIISEESDCFKKASEIIIESIITDYNDDILLGYIQISNEIKEIWKFDNGNKSNNEVYKTANYLVNELLECDDNDNIDLKRFFTQYFSDCHFENKNVIKKFKIIE